MLEGERSVPLKIEFFKLSKQVPMARYVLSTISNKILDEIEADLANETRLDLAIENNINEPQLRNRLIDILVSRVTDLTFCIGLGFTCTDYSEILSAVLLHGKLIKLQYQNYSLVLANYAMMHVLYCIVKSKLRILTTEYDILHEEYDILKHNRTITSYNSAGWHSWQRDYNREMEQVAEENKARILAIKQKCIIIIGSGFAYRDLRTLIVKYIWNARYV